MTSIEALQRLHWTSHNIELAPGVQTLPGQPLLRDEVRARAIFRELRRFAAREGGFTGQRALDLGCLEGGFTLELARAGFDALGVEGRDSNFAKCRALAAHVALPNLRFELCDVKALSESTHGRFDVVLCLGLLYHLDDPVAFVEQLGRGLTAERALMFLDTHIAPVDEAAMQRFEGRSALSERVTVEHRGHAYAGRWYHEYDAQLPGAPDAAWTSVSNALSFWLTEPALIAALVRGGFDQVYTVYGNFEIGEEFELRARHSRAWYVAVKA
jgi:SAM-dependent methyltransferase